MQLLLVRHGNTFEKGQPSRWVGARTDLPLTETGREQARLFGRFLKDFQIQVAAIFAGPMLRHREHAAVIASTLGMDQSSIQSDPRLQEIDHGEWEGKTNAQVGLIAEAEAVRLWNENSVWPSGQGWATSEEELGSRVRDFLQQMGSGFGEHQNVIIVSSGGTLRYFCKEAIAERLRPTSLKVATGNVGSISSLGGGWRLNYWNRTPSDLPV